MKHSDHAPTTKKTAVIIGGGISGLATAALLSRDGWQVTLLEKNATLGGRARALKKNGFHFDMGPSWYLMPEVFEQFFAEFGKKPEDYYELIRLDPKYTVHFHDGEAVTLSNDLHQTQQWFESQEAGAGKTLERFLKRLELTYTLATRRLMYTDVFNWKNWLSKDRILDAARLLPRLPWHQTWHQYIAGQFQNPKLQKILEFPAVFLGGSPYNTPSLFSILSWNDFGQGVFYPQGGMYRCIEALSSLAEEMGAKLRTNAEVTSLIFTGNTIQGVRIGKEELRADIIINASDAATFETQLLPNSLRVWNSDDLAQKELGISGLILYLGLNKKLKKQVHHHLYFSENWEKNFTEILTEKVLPGDPSFYISQRTATDPSIAPKDHEELFVLVPLGSSLEYTEDDITAFTHKILTKLEDILGENITDHLVVKDVFTPNDFASAYNAYQGTALGLAHTLEQSLWGRAEHQHPKVSGLYSTGLYTFPGVGVPMALISAQLVNEKIRTRDQQNSAIFKKGSITYYYSSLFFEKQAKKDVFTLYSYVRTIDDIIDSEKPDTKLLEYYWQQTTEAWKTNQSEDPIVRGFIRLAKRKNFSWDWITGFWSAMRQDLVKKHYNSFEELVEYMYGSAEVIGLMMAQILDLPPEAAHAAQIQGRAMQYVNFIRDVGEDKALGKNYLGYTDTDTSSPEAWSAFIRTHLENFRRIQKEATTGYQYLPYRYRVPVQTAAQMYEWTADEILANPQRVWHEKIRPEPWRVVWTALHNTWRLR